MRNIIKMAAVMGGGKKVVTLPQNLLTSAPVVIDDFENVALWSAASSSARAANATQFKVGTQSMKSTAAAGAQLDTRRDYGVSTDFSAPTRFGMWVYTHDAIADYSADPDMRLYEDAGHTKYYKFATVRTQLVPGAWTYWNMLKTRAVPTGAPPDWGIWMLQMKGNATATKTPSFSYDQLFSYSTAQPAMMMMFDDAQIGIYQNAYPAMKAVGLRGTVFVITSKVGTAGYMTWANLHELENAGWCIANHTQNHTDLTTLSEAQQETEMLAGKTDLEAQGFIKGSKYLAFPSTNWNTNTMTAMAATGMLIGRSGYTHLSRASAMPLFDPYRIEGTVLTNVITTATVQGYIDSCISEQSILPPYMHNIGIDGDQYTTGDFTTIVNYWSTKRAQMPAITVDDLYKLQSGPVSVLA